MISNKISLILTVYNEEKRLEACLNSISNVFDEVVVFDKGSTDKTLEILKEFHKVKIVNIPLTERGKEDMNFIFSKTRNNTIFIITASEILPLNFFNNLSSFIDNNNYDLLMVPRKMVVFQKHINNSPWSISYYPFLFDKTKILLSERLHENFQIADEKSRGFLPLDKKFIIPHITHNMFENYCSHNHKYIENEFEFYKDNPYAIRICKDNIKIYSKLQNSDNAYESIHYSAWSLYWNSIIIKILEYRHNIDYNNSSYELFIEKVLNHKEIKNKLYRPSNYFILKAKKAYRKLYKFEIIRKLRKLI